ncbi:hypothetical protein, partial [Capnocytophaga sp. oral taxon 332]|uniref:hypothetical protein n=1 Tax=Capnocytophaga sp. oral taxon 332 TaxID=712213 RepID=UPI001E5214FA
DCIGSRRSIIWYCYLTFISNRWCRYTTTLRRCWCYYRYAYRTCGGRSVPIWSLSITLPLLVPPAVTVTTSGVATIGSTGTTTVAVL